MRCPIDGTELRIADRQGVEIDYCPQCRGVWLDRGELDKIIDRAYGAPQGAAGASEADTPAEGAAFGEWVNPAQAPQPRSAQPNYPPQNYPQPNHPQQHPQQPPQGVGGANPAQSIVPAIGGLIAGLAASQAAKGHHGHYGRHKRKKHKGWFDEMFDFDED